MSKLQYFGRPWVEFSAKNPQHREWFYNFQRDKTWGHCPVRFILAETSSNLITQIQRELVDYYVQQEFGTKTNPDHSRLDRTGTKLGNYIPKSQAMATNT